MPKLYTTEAVCAWCGTTFQKRTSYYNRSIRRGAPMYCDKHCTGMARRSTKPKEQAVIDKAEYDRQYRAKNKVILKAKKAARHKATYTPEKGRAHRAKRKAQGWDHSAYCRRRAAEGTNRADKAEYDRRYRAERIYGEFAEVFLVYLDLQAEVRERITWYDAKLEQGYFARQSRKRREREQHDTQNET